MVTSEKSKEWLVPSLRGTVRGSQAQRSYDYVKQEVLRGRFQVSETLPIDTLAQEIDVSRQPILDAMRRLASEHLVEIIPQVGCRLVTHTLQEIHDFFRLFAAVEALLAEFAAERHDERQMRRLRLVSEEIAALRSPKVGMAKRSEGYRTLNREFHGIIHEMARAPEIAALSKSYFDRSDFYLTSSSSHRLFAERLHEANDEHESLITALAARKGSLAARTMNEHVLGFRNQLLEILSGTKNRTP
jgi:DNA-binding GntR family transcriptional regulator